MNSSSHDANDLTTRERLLQVGLEEFAKHGFDGATVRQICQRASANLNSIKHHFGDKRAFYAAVLEYCQAEGGPPAAPELPLDAAAEKQLEQFIHALVRTIFSRRQAGVNPYIMPLMMRELEKPTPGLNLGLKMFIFPIWKLLNRILARLLPDDIETIDQHLLAFSVMGQITSYRFNLPVMRTVVNKSEFERMTAKRVADHITRVTLAAARAMHRSDSVDESANPDT